MLSLKACPRCGGDVNSNRDIYGHYKVCLQCGYMADVAKPDGALSVPRARVKREAA